MGFPGKRNPKNLQSGQPGSKGPQRRTVIRQGLLERVIAEWDRRDVAVRLESKGKFESYLASLSKDQFFQLIKTIVPRQQNVNLSNDGEALQKLLSVAQREQPSGSD